MSTLTELHQLLKDKFDLDVAALPADASMTASGMDSLAVAEFMFAVEDHFHITLPDDDPNINSLEQLADLVDRTRAAQAAAASTTPVTTAPAAVSTTAD